MTVGLVDHHPTVSPTGVPSRVSLTLEENMAFNEWNALGERLLRMHTSSQWWIGDWLCYGDRYRRQYTAAMDQIDHTFRTLRGYAYVASHVQSATRVADLSWTHHRIIAPLDAADQRYFLGEALRHGWTSRELVDAIAERVGLPAPASAHEPTLTIRTADDLSALCIRAAIHAGLAPALWATGVLERAARLELA